MAIVSSVDNQVDLLRGYEQDPIREYAESFLNVAKAGVTESSVSIFDDPGTYLRKTSTKEALKKFFMNESYDIHEPKFDPAKNPNAAKAIQEHMKNMAQIFENDSVAAIRESAQPLGAFNPVMGMALPMHKNLLMNAVFEQVMPKGVATSPKFTLTLETRNMYDINHNKIDMFLEQNRMSDAITNSVPQMDVIIPVPEYQTIDILKDKFNVTGTKHNLSIKSAVTGIIVNTWVAVDDFFYDATTQKTRKCLAADVAGMKPVIFDTGKISFTPTYGAQDRIMRKAIQIQVTTDAVGTVKTLKCNITGAATKDNKFEFEINGPDSASISAIRFHAVVDVSSAAYPTVKFNWEARTDFFEIPEAPHISCQVTPEAVKDIQALYDINQITKLMSMMRLAMLHWKDDSIHNDLDESFSTLPARQKVVGAVDWAPPVGQFMGSPIQWRHEMFIDQLDMYTSRLLQVLNDENMTILVIGRPEIIKRITPQNLGYSTPSNIGPVELDFQRTIVTSEKRVYNFISSQKMRNNNNLIMLLIPRNTMRITYQIIDYQLYVSNEIRDTEAFELPSMTCFERWMFLQYQPIQGRINVLNVKGTREDLENPDPIGRNAMNDDTANDNTYSSAVNGVTATKGTAIGQNATTVVGPTAHRVVEENVGDISPKTM